MNQNPYQIYEYDARIAQALEQAIDPETGEIVNEWAVEYLEALGMDRDKVIEDGLLLWKQLTSEAAAIKAEIDALKDRYERKARRADNLKSFWARYLNGEKFETAKVATQWRKSEVAVYDGAVEDLPEEFKRYKAPELNKDALKKALKGGLKLPGARLEQKNNMSIK